jgi:PST family polysaccharide transporter
MLGQLTNFSNILLIFSNGGINAGITKYLSEFSDSGNKNRIFLATGFWITLICSAVIGILMVLGASWLSAILLNDTAYRVVFIIFGVTIIFYAFNAYLLAVINGFKDYRKYVIANISGSLIGFVFSVALSLKFGLLGALISSITFQSVVFLVTLYLVRRESWFNLSHFRRLFSWVAASKLSQYSLMAIVSAVTVPGSQIIVRKMITDLQSIHQAGLWEGMNRISTMYLYVIMTSITVYFLPRLSEIKEEKELRTEIHSVYKLMVPFLLFSIIVIYFIKDFLITLLFTPEFAQMRELFMFQLIGDLLKMCGWILGSILLAKAMTRLYIFMEFLNFFIICLFSYPMIKWYGTVGATYAYAITHFIYLAVLAFVFRKLLVGKGGANMDKGM